MILCISELRAQTHKLQTNKRGVSIMHWAETIAQKIIQKNPNKEEYVCAAGISPSGSIHIGNFRDIATSCPNGTFELDDGIPF